MKRTGLILAILGLCLGVSSTANAQSQSLRDLLSQFVLNGVTLAPPQEGVNHSAHFISATSPQVQALLTLSESIGRQLSTYPLSSSAGGFSYLEDPELGILIRQTQSFGPVYAERPLTLGKGKYNLGVGYTEFSFDRIGDLNLREGELNLVFTHKDVNDDECNLHPELEGDVVTAELFINFNSKVKTLSGSYGVTDKLDMSLVVPMVEVSATMSAQASVNRLATGDREIHGFEGGGTTSIIQEEGRAEGLGDILLRGKYQLLQKDDLFIAAMGDLRLPTGDERDLLGAGATQGKLQVLVAKIGQRFSPHLNLGYTAANHDLPNQINGIAGFEWVADDKLTLAFDVLSRTQLGVSPTEMVNSTFQYVPMPDELPVSATPATCDHDEDIQTADFPILTVGEETNIHQLDGSLGLKLNVAGNFLLTLNGLFPLNHESLTDEFSGLIALDYSF